MKNKTNTFKKLPGVLAFKRGHVLSDALMYSRMPDGNDKPLQVIRHGIRGTQNVVGSTEKAASNVQVTETAKLDPGTNAMIVRFELAFLPLREALNACSGAVNEGKDAHDIRDFRNSIEYFLDRANASEGLNEVARRYARNIANGRWLWRNRTIASSVQIEVKRGNAGDNTKDLPEFVSFDALKISLKDFDGYTKEEEKLGEEIASQMRGQSQLTLIVTAIVKLRTEGSEVFPSQNYIEDKPKGFARPLYKVGHPETADKTNIRVMGQAALRDQKVSNAIRTIDTWYPLFEEERRPIPIEPQGANLEMNKFFRDKKESSFELFKQLDQIDPNTDEGMFCIACFERGGVYSESDKTEKKKKKKKGEE